MRPITLGLLLAAAAAAPLPAQSATLTLSVDSAKREVIALVGPFDLAAMPAMPAMSHEMSHDMEHSSWTPMIRFTWPVEGDIAGADVQVVDASGARMPQHYLHHLVMHNFDRRQLVHNSVEHLFGWGQDTKPIMLPAGVGAPVPPGTHLGFLVAWHNDSGREIHGAFVRLVMTYRPVREVKVAVLPFYVDMHYVGGASTSYDLPAGRSTSSYDFTLPVGGRLIAVGGHLHEYGRWVELVDAASGKVLVKLTSQRDAAGHHVGMGRFIFGFHDDALRLDAHRPYRLVAEYDNRSGHAIAMGAMANLSGLFQPDDLARWPALHAGDAEVMKDLAALPPDLGAAEDEHAHMDMDMAGDSTMAMPMHAAAESASRPPRER